MLRAPLLLAVVLGLTGAGCGPSSSLEASPPLLPVEQPFPVEPPAPPAAPEAPRLSPCPAGWAPSAIPGAGCEPWPEGGMQSCPAGQAHFPGEPGCTVVGSACAADGWPAALPAGRTVVYALAAAPAGGDGSRARPFSTVAQALAGGAAGNVLALGPGTYPMPGPLPQGTSLYGGCAAQTTLTLAAGSTQPAVVYSQSPGIEVHDVRVSAPAVGLAAAGATAQLRVEGVEVLGAASIGWLVQDRASATGVGVVVRDTSAGSSGMLGDGLHVTDGSTVSLTRGVLDGNRTTGVFVYGAGASVTLTQVAVVNTLATSGTTGRGVWANQGAHVALVSAVVEGNRRSGIEALANASVQLTDVVVRRTLAAPSGRGDGVWVAAGATLTGQRVRVESSANLGVGVTDANSRATLIDFVSRGDFGVGANAGAAVSLERAWLDGIVGTAVTSRATGALVSLTDVLVTGTRAPPGQPNAAGVSVTRGAAVTLQRVRVERSQGGGLSVASAGSTLVGSDLEVADTQPGTDGEGGFPFTVALGASASLERALVRSGATAGLYVLGPAVSLSLTDVEVRDIQAPASQGGLYGNGVVAAEGASLSATRLRLSGNHDVGLLFSDANTTATVSDLSVSTTALDCTQSTKCGDRVASGLTVLGGATAQVSRFLVTGNGGFGVQVAPGAQLDLADGEVSFHDIGASVLGPEFDVARLDQRVVYRHNSQKLSAQVVPLPTVPPPPKLAP